MNDPNPDDADARPTGALWPGGGGGDEDVALASALGALRPADAGLDAGEALFEAGRRAGERAARLAGRRQLFAWRAAAAVLLAAGGLAVAARPAPAVVDRVRVVYADPPPASPRPTDDARPSPAVPLSNVPTSPTASTVPPADVGPAAPPADARPDSLLALRQVALDQGVDRLPAGDRGWVSSVRARGMALP